jgi:hypothetical protein
MNPFSFLDENYFKIGVLMYRMFPGIRFKCIDIEWLVLNISAHADKVPQKNGFLQNAHYTVVVLCMLVIIDEEINQV